MKFLYALVLVSFLSFTKDDKKELIAWNPTYKLQWQDFKAKPEANSLKAMTWSTITVEDFKATDNSITLRVSAWFIKNKSWKQKDVSDAYLLLHEQTHFDITELYARRLRKKISEAKFTSAKQGAQQIGLLSNGVYSESAAEQKKYDAETKHSINKDAQDKWNKSIADELQNLNAYSNTELNITIK